MKTLSRWIFSSLASAILLASAPTQVSAQAPTDSDAPVVHESPTSLTELVEPGAVAAIHYDYHLLKRSTNSHRENDRTHGVHFLVEVDDDTITFHTEREAANFQGEQHSRLTTVYDLDGQLLRGEFAVRHPRWHGTQTFSVLDGGQIEYESNGRVPGGRQSHNESVRPYPADLGFVPDDWLPLVLAYHIRAGHEQFSVLIGSLHNMSGPSPRSELTLRLVGEEDIQIGNEVYPTFVFAVETRRLGVYEDSNLPDADGERLYCLESGQIVRQVRLWDGVENLAELSTPDQIAEAIQSDIETNRDAPSAPAPVETVVPTPGDTPTPTPGGEIPAPLISPVEIPQTSPFGDPDSEETND